MDCPVYCAGGTCVSEYFREDFESATLSAWIFSASEANAALVTDTATEGSAQSLRVQPIVTYGSATLLKSVPEHQPQAVSFWVRASANAVQEVSLFGATGTPLSLFTFRLDHNVMLIYPQTGSTTWPRIANTWYHIELRNLNWLGRTVDFYVDGTLTQAGVALRGPDYGISDIRISCGVGSTECRVDQIEFQP